MDLQRNGFVEHVRDAGNEEAQGSVARGRVAPDPFKPAQVDSELAARWIVFEDLPLESLGRSVWEMYDGRGFALPGTPGGAPKYLAQHDFAHVLADYDTNLKGELEVFAFIGRADPDPKGFAWLATLIGLFETGYIADSGFFERDVRERNVQAPGMHQRIADAIRRGKVVCEHYGMDLFDVEYYDLADPPVAEIRDLLAVRCDNPAMLVEVLERWDLDQATTNIMGYMGTRLLDVVDGEPEYRHYDELYRTDR